MSTEELEAFRAVGFKLKLNVNNFGENFLCEITQCDFRAKSVFCTCKRSSRWQMHGKIRCESSVLKLLSTGAVKTNMETQGKI